MRSRKSPRGVAEALAPFTRKLAPVSLLADVQGVWPSVAGAALASRAEPTAGVDGVVTLTCESAVWAQELTLMAPELTRRINAALGAERVTELRCSAHPGKAWARASR